MSAINFSAKVEKEETPEGETYVNMSFRGKWLPYVRW